MVDLDEAKSLVKYLWEQDHLYASERRLLELVIEELEESRKLLELKNSALRSVAAIPECGDGFAIRDDGDMEHSCWETRMVLRARAALSTTVELEDW